MRNSHGLGRAIALGTIIGIVVLALIAGGVVALRSFGAVGQPSYSPAPDQETTEVEGTGRVEFGARAATLNDDRESTIRFSIPELPEDIWQVFEEHAEPMIITSPLEITADPSLTGIVTLTRTYPVPVPEDAGATFAYFDTDLSAWVVKSTRVVYLPFR